MNYKHLKNPKARMEVLNVIETFNLVEICRETSPNLKRYRLRRKNPMKQATRDFFLISETLTNRVPQTEYENSYLSDHSPVILEYKVNKESGGIN